MNKIASHLSAAAVGVVVAFTPMRWEIDRLRAAALQSAAREENMSKQLAAALDISGKMDFLRLKVDSAADHCRTAENVISELLALAKKAKPASAPAPSSPAPTSPRREQVQNQDAKSCPEKAPAPTQKPAAPAPEVKPQAVAGVGIKVDAGAMVDAHNRLRAEVGVPGLGWSDKLAEVAQGWADHLAADNCGMYHSATKYGENLYYAGAVSWSSGRRAMQPISATRPVQMWGAEKQGYYAATGECSAPDGCGHYTQVVWKATTEVGCGMAVCGNKAQIWVCNYFPAGNVAGQKPY